MTSKKYYTAIFLPLILIVSTTLYFNESSIILLIFCYYIYRCILDYYVLKYNYNKARDHFQQVKPMLECFEKYFGPYPFYKDGYTLIETPYLGMEHQSAIAYGNNYLPGYNGNKQFIAGLDFDYYDVWSFAYGWIY